MAGDNARLEKEVVFTMDRKLEKEGQSNRGGALLCIRASFLMRPLIANLLSL